MPEKSYGSNRYVEETPDGISDLNLNAALKTTTMGFYHTLKRASPEDIYKSNYLKWLADSKIWKEKMKLRLLTSDAGRLNYLLEIDVSLAECLAYTKKRVHDGEEVSTRTLLGWLYPYFVGINDFTEAALIESYAVKGYGSFKRAKQRLDTIIEYSITRNKFPRQIRIGTTNYTFYILDTAEPLPKERIREGHTKTWAGMTENAEIFAESIDEIIQHKRSRNPNVSLAEVSYPFVVGRALRKYTKKMKEGSLAV